MNNQVTYSPTVTAQEFFKHGIAVWDNFDRALTWNPDKKTWDKPNFNREAYYFNELNDPEQFKLGPVKKTVPFTRYDIKSNMLFFNQDNVFLEGPALAICRDGIYLLRSSIAIDFVTYNTLQKNYKWRNEGEDPIIGYPCEKEIEVDD